MKWYEYIHQHSKEISSIFEEDEAIAILKKIAAHISGAYYSSIKNTEISSDNMQTANAILEELRQGRPLQYILGEVWFYKYPFKVNESVLIPRPETEELIEWAFQHIRNLPLEKKSLKILDIGTGSGCIPVTIKKERPEAHITSIDISPYALATARENAATLQTDIEFLELDFLNESLWNDLSVYDVIISNPPYIPVNEKEKLSVNVHHYEPHLALFVPENQPLQFYQKIASFGKSHLLSGGIIFVELHQDLAEETKKVFEENGYQNVVIKKDISGNYRMLKACK